MLFFLCFFSIFLSFYTPIKSIEPIYISYSCTRYQTFYLYSICYNITEPYTLTYLHFFVYLSQDHLLLYSYLYFLQHLLQYGLFLILLHYLLHHFYRLAVFKTSISYLISFILPYTSSLIVVFILPTSSVFTTVLLSFTILPFTSLK